MITVLSRTSAVKVAVVAVAAIALGWNIWNTGMVSGYIDPVRKLGAQDEAVYAREAIHMALRGNWLTQTFLDRFVLFKPPLLIWLSAASVKLFGVSSLPIRLPSIASGVLICLLAFLMSRKAGWAALVLLVSDRLFHTLARASLTDMLLCACLTLCLWAFSRDTAMARRRTVFLFGAGAGLAILTKSIAGLLPFAVVGLFWIFCRGVGRPSIRRLLLSAAVAACVALPWHVYQAIVHPQWFLAEYLGVQLLAFGGKPPQTSQENQIVFYCTRLWYGDPELVLLSVAAIPAFFAATRKRDSLAMLLACWLAIFGAALMIFQYRSVQYMLPLIPALAIASASFLPALQKRLTLAILCVASAVKAASPSATWGLPYQSGNTLPESAALSAYCEQQRNTDLMILDPQDEFYSAVLPLGHVRYGIVDPAGRNFRLEPHLHWLGITLNVGEFESGRSEPFAARLRSWGLPDAKPLGTTVFGQSVAEFQGLVAQRPGTDFLVPRSWLSPEMVAGREVRIASDTRVFLLAPKVGKAGASQWSCRI